MPGSGRGRDQRTYARDRRARRHEETRSQILDLAVAIMTDDGVAGLSMASLARALSIQPPSLYKYFASRMAVYDALFRQGQLANLEALRSGMRGAAPGMDAVAAGMEAAGRWAVSHPVLAQLLFWRPVPGFQPTADAFAPALEIIDQLRRALRDAAAAGQVHPDAASDQHQSAGDARRQSHHRDQVEVRPTAGCDPRDIAQQRAEQHRDRAASIEFSERVVKAAGRSRAARGGALPAAAFRDEPARSPPHDDSYYRRKHEHRSP